MADQDNRIFEALGAVEVKRRRKLIVEVHHLKVERSDARGYGCASLEDEGPMGGDVAGVALEAIALLVDELVHVIVELKDLENSGTEPPNQRTSPRGLS